MGNSQAVLCTVFDRRTREDFERLVQPPQNWLVYKGSSVTILQAEKIDRIVCAMKDYCFSPTRLERSATAATYQHRDKISSLRNDLDEQLKSIDQLERRLRQAFTIGFESLRIREVKYAGDASTSLNGGSDAASGTVRTVEVSTDPATVDALIKPIADIRADVLTVGKALFQHWLAWHRGPLCNETVYAFPPDSPSRNLRIPAPAVPVNNGYASVLQA